MFLSLLLLATLSGEISSAEATIECASSISGGSCELHNYFRGPWPDRKPCRVARVFFPTSEPELVAAVAFAVRHKHKVKVVSKNVHSHNKIACPNDGSNPGVLISTSKYNSTVVVDEKSMTVIADAGVGLRELIDQAASKGFALVQTTFWDGVSVSGMVSTGAHGSSLWGLGGGTHEYLVGMRIVVPASQEEGFAKVVTLTDREPESFNAARISLGVLGAVSQVTFAVEPMFKRSVAPVAMDDASLEEEYVDLARRHEFGDMYWFPSVKKFVLKRDDRVPVTRTGEGVFTLAGFKPVKASAAKRARLDDERAQATVNSTYYCENAHVTMRSKVSSGSGYLNDGSSFTGFPVVGFNHKLQTTGGCQYTYENLTNLELPEAERLVCAWDFNAHGFFGFDVSISIALSQVSSFIRDVKAILARDPTAMCAIDTYGGLWLRNVRASRAYLGEKRDVTHVEFFAFNHRDSARPQAYEAIMEELEQILLFKYDGMPHLGKNRPHTFKNIRSKTRNLAKFLEVRRKMDPDGWFSSEWSDAVLGIRGSVVSSSDGCAPGGLCVCSEDRHCAPEEGYLCKPGIVYKEARVCTKTSHSTAK
ncbi:hypothetical protein SELMODRAFT_97935 [Selaginella moellendorffii]|uniref:L-gulonolactone oxidase n=1 Tax=Selaginella moellendorffii TaxID=88036 RepID=D8RNQ7_SELML|nr:L-gulonolactone oxidase 5 [Selaginella moellendorffii]EFJ26123.1 hypothetical protein SELMODRAFT_97935 [Selaginella moellendorffii]|eukprot:XP_002972902.1 L-gulonolactone oxidase 5 [Selaginella moellendorffii]